MSRIKLAFWTRADCSHFFHSLCIFPPLRLLSDFIKNVIIHSLTFLSVKLPFFCENGELALIIVDQGQGQGVMGIGGLKKRVGCTILIRFGMIGFLVKESSEDEESCANVMTTFSLVEHCVLDSEAGIIVNQ